MKIRATTPSLPKPIASEKSGSRHATLARRIKVLLTSAANTLWQQHGHPCGYGIGEDDAIAEANMVLHIGAAAIREGYTPWMESPFGTAKKTHTIKNARAAKSPRTVKNGLKHLDLAINLGARQERQSLLLVEAKRLCASDRNKKVKEIIADCKRLRAWSRVSRKPTAYLVDGYEALHGAIVVLCPDEPRLAPRGTLTFKKWWKSTSLQGTPDGFQPEQIGKLRSFIAPMKRRGVKSSYRDDPEKQLTILYAYASLGDERKGLLDQ